MPLFRVTFERTVRYLPDHPHGYDTTVLLVNADSEAGAMRHAIRTTLGDGGDMTVEPFTPIANPPIEDTYA